MLKQLGKLIFVMDVPETIFAGSPERAIVLFIMEKAALPW